MELDPGEPRTVEFDVHTDLSGFTRRDLHRRVEPGHIVPTVAQSDGDLGRSADVDLEGEVHIIDHTRTMDTPVRL